MPNLGRFALALGSLLGIVAAPSIAGAQRSLPFEVAVVVDECATTFDFDRLLSALDAQNRHDALEVPDRSARSIRVSFRAEGCHEDRTNVRVAIDVGDSRIVHREFDVAPRGRTLEQRSDDLATATHRTLRGAWPTLVAAAGNPYVTTSERSRLHSNLDVRLIDEATLDVVPNPYRVHHESGSNVAGADELAANPYREADASHVPLANPYR